MGTVISPIHPGERLHRLDSRKPLIHLHSAKQWFIEAGLELVGDQQNLVLIRFEGLPQVASVVAASVTLARMILDKVVPIP
jgi:hypothetical protein